MKAVFPCKGVVVLAKKDIELLENFYNKKLSTSKMSEIYNSTEYMLQVGNLNYIPPKSKLLVDEENLLTLSQLRSVMQETNINKQNNLKPSSQELSDDDILSHPFFTTLKPLN